MIKEIKLFVPYELAKKLQEIGFNEPCMANWLIWLPYKSGDYLTEKTAPNIFYNNQTDGTWFNHNGNDIVVQYRKEGKELCSAPMYQQVLDWFRENHKIHIESSIGHDEDKIWWNIYLYKVELGYDFNPINKDDDIGGCTYYEALNNGIKEALKLIK